MPETRRDILPSLKVTDSAIHRLYNPRYHPKNHSTKKQNAMKLPNIIPSLLFFAPILAIKLLIPGT